MKIDTKELYSFNEYAKKVGKSLSWVYYASEEGKIETVVISGFKFIRERKKKN